MLIVGLDFETYSPVDIAKHGLYRYTEHEHFTPLIAAIKTYDTDRMSTRHIQFDFILQDNDQSQFLEYMNKLYQSEEVQPFIIAAHNADFEQEVLTKMGVDWLDPKYFIDTSILARAFGASSSLEAAAPQLLGSDKLEVGKSLIRLFSIPSKEQVKQGDLAFKPDIVRQHRSEWDQFQFYCLQDATLSTEFALKYKKSLSIREEGHAAVTSKMNQAGWFVDIQAVKQMQKLYFDNLQEIREGFIERHGPGLNFNSFPQLKAWCEKRGVRAKSFDEKNVNKLIKALNKKLSTPLSDDQYMNYLDVLDMLQTKQKLGGSSLTKLQAILDMVDSTGRLKGQYLHCGAGQTWRTSGRGVQMQNLKRIQKRRDLIELYDENAKWTNEELAENLRQVFTAEDPKGYLVVGDFSSIESRGLAWLAGAEWKLDAFRQGRDLYKVSASNIYNKAYDAIDKDERQTGKVGELSCGYGAGPDAVAAFAENMGVDMTPASAAALVRDWREINPEIVMFWEELDGMLREIMRNPLHMYNELHLPEGYVLRMMRIDAPESLRIQTGDCDLGSLEIQIINPARTEVFMTRIFHGVHSAARNIRYWKPTKRKTGDLWSDRYIDPKTGLTRFYEIYGGKLSGILTQSLCREIFFRALKRVDIQFSNPLSPFHKATKLVGQFHDEIVLELSSGSEPPEFVAGLLESTMKNDPSFTTLPLEAEVNFHHRYIK